VCADEDERGSGARVAGDADEDEESFEGGDNVDDGDDDEAEAEKITDPFIKKGLLYVADGVEPEFLKEVLQNEIEAKSGEYERAA
jgi:flagellar motor component MotA